MVNEISQKEAPGKSNRKDGQIQSACTQNRDWETWGFLGFFHPGCFFPMRVQNNEELFELLMQKYIYFLDHVKDETYLTFTFVEPIMYDCLRKSMGV